MHRVNKAATSATLTASASQQTSRVRSNVRWGPASRLLLEMLLLVACVYLAYVSRKSEQELAQTKDQLQAVNVRLLEEQEKHMVDPDAPLDNRELVVAAAESRAQKAEDRASALERQAVLRNKEISRIRTRLSDVYRKQCELRFSAHPARILMRTSQGDMEFEMAPCDVMPVVTMHFISQVESQFWDGMSFFRAETHVIQATSMRPDQSRPPRAHQHGLSIPFQEYSDKFPHHKFTLGIAGRPGGPDFYINMQENLAIHGPGGQGHNYQGDAEADSCFAKLVKGEDVALQIQSLPFNRENGLHILKTPVEIIQMRLLEP